MTPTDIIINYLVAYRSANGHDLPYSILYERGWFVFSRYGFRVRKTKLLEMTKRLLDRADGRAP